MEYSAAGRGRKSAGQILAEITESLVQFHRRFYGKGPSQAKSYSINDTIVCMLHGGFTPVERTLIDDGVRLCHDSIPSLEAAQVPVERRE